MARRRRTIHDVGDAIVDQIMAGLEELAATMPEVDAFVAAGDVDGFRAYVRGIDCYRISAVLIKVGYSGPFYDALMAEHRPPFETRGNRMSTIRELNDNRTPTRDGSMRKQKYKTIDRMLVHFSEMQNGDQITFRRYQNRWQIISFDGDCINTGFGETLMEAFDNEI